jgi:hypothetical protein
LSRGRAQPEHQPECDDSTQECDDAHASLLLTALEYAPAPKGRRPNVVRVH